MLALSNWGCGEGLSVVVHGPQSRAENATPTGTTTELRRLTMKEAGEVLRKLGLADADVKKLRRWDRILMVRELSS
jgi:hypothetical protein